MLLIWSNFDPSRYFAERLEVFLSHSPAGTSFRNMIHFAQIIGRKNLQIQKLDLGKKSRNLEAYGTEERIHFHLNDYFHMKTTVVA